MIYSPKEIVVDAIQMPTRFSVGAVAGDPGDWLICDPDGDVSILPDALFQKLFAVDDEDAAVDGNAGLRALRDLTGAAAHLDRDRLDLPDDLPAAASVASFGATVLDGAQSMHVNLQGSLDAITKPAPPDAEITAQAITALATLPCGCPTGAHPESYNYDAAAAVRAGTAGAVCRLGWPEIANRAARILDHSGFPMVPHWMSRDQPRAGASAECKIDGRAVAVFPADERCIECGGPVIHQPVDDKDAGTRVLFGADSRAVVHNRCRQPLTPADRAAILETASAPYGPRFDGESLLIIFRRYEETIAALERKVGK